MLPLSQSDSINQILGSDENSFEVPLYQRRYVWDKTNWKTLWEDIFDQAEIDPGERGVGHFTGPIVTRLSDENIDGRQNRYEVIDGQQRLTTLEIIFCIIKDLCSGVEDLKNDGAVETAKKHVMDRSDNHKLVLTKYDKLTFEKIVEGQYGDKIHDAFDDAQNKLQPEQVEKVIAIVFADNMISSNILDAYNYFYEQIRLHIQENSENADNLLSTITSDFKLIHLSLGETEQAEKVFESINATGRRLSDFDYLRNNLFLRARKLGTDENGNFYRDAYYNNSKFLAL